MTTSGPGEPTARTRSRSVRRGSASSTCSWPGSTTGAARRCVVAAADPGGDLDRVVRALRARSLGLAELEVAEAHGVVTLDGDRVTFRHPLMRSAAYHDAARADRRAAHRALADTLPDRSATRAWHLARAAVGPDEGVAARSTRRPS